MGKLNWELIDQSKQEENVPFTRLERTDEDKSAFGLAITRLREL